MTGAHIHKGKMKSIFKEKKVVVFTSLAAGVLLLVGAVVALAIRSSNNKGSTPSSGSLLQPNLLKLEEIKSMEEPRLRNLRDEYAGKIKAHEDMSTEYYICQANISLLDALLFDRSGWNAEIFNAWMNTGFRTVRCPEFVAWVEHHYEKFPYSKQASGNHLIDHVATFHRSIGELDNNEEERFQSGMAEVAWNGIGLSDAGTDLREDVVKLLQSDDPEYAKVFLNRYQNEKLLADIRPSFHLLMCDKLDSMVKFVGAMLNFVSGLHINLKKKPKTPTEFMNKLSTFKDTDRPEDAYIWWTECVNKHDEDVCMDELNFMEMQHLYEQRIEDLEKKYKRVKQDRKKEKLRLFYEEYLEGKFGLLMALHAYIEMRDHIRKVDESDLRKQASSVFGATTFESSNLSADTFVKDRNLHYRLSDHFRLCGREKEWKSFNDIMRSLNENRAKLEATNCNIQLLERLISSLKEDKTYQPKRHTNYLQMKKNQRGIKKVSRSKGPEYLLRANRSRDTNKLIADFEKEKLHIESNAEASILPKLSDWITLHIH